MKMIILFVFLLRAFLIFADDYSIKFRGEDLFDEKTGIMATVDDDKKFIAVSNQLYHYVLVLPYSINWVFSIDNKYCLIASNENINISIELLSNMHNSDADYLDYLQDQLTNNSDSMGITDIRRVYYENYSMIRTEVEILKVFKKLDADKYRDMITVNLYSTKSYNNERFVLHFAVTKKRDDNSFDERSFYNNITNGFFVDFERR